MTNNILSFFTGDFSTFSFFTWVRFEENIRLFFCFAIGIGILKLTFLCFAISKIFCVGLSDACDHVCVSSGCPKRNSVLTFFYINNEL